MTELKLIKTEPKLFKQILVQCCSWKQEKGVHLQLFLEITCFGSIFRILFLELPKNTLTFWGIVTLHAYILFFYFSGHLFSKLSISHCIGQNYIKNRQDFISEIIHNKANLYFWLHLHKKYQTLSSYYFY